MAHEAQKSPTSDHEPVMLNRILLQCLSKFRKFRRQCSLLKTIFLRFSRV